MEHSIQKMQIANFPTAHGTFYRIDHMLAYKSSLGKFQKSCQASFLTTCNETRNELQEKYSKKKKKY